MMRRFWTVLSLCLITSLFWVGTLRPSSAIPLSRPQALGMTTLFAIASPTLSIPDPVKVATQEALDAYQAGQTTEAIHTLRTLVRQYPIAPGIRAALSAVLWEQGKRGEAESQWVAVIGLEPQYQDLGWVRETQTWPPTVIAALEKFLHRQ